MSLENLPRVTEERIDGNLGQIPINNNPIVIVIGTASKGDAETLTQVNKTGASAKTFGREGTLVKGMYEVAQSGALNIQLFRILALSAKLTGVGTGITITTARKDDTAGTDYKLFWDDTAKRLRVYRTSDDVLVYDSNPTYPDSPVDLGEVYVSGTYSGTPGNIGSLATPITLAAANGVSGAVFTAGSDGLRASRMKLWEGLYKAYKLLDDADADHIVPMNAYLDDLNIQDLTTAQVTALQVGAPWAAGANTHPIPGDQWDYLGKVYAQEYQGEWYFWWDLNRNGVADIWPVGVGSSSSSTNIDGTGLTPGDFHEVNFGYELAHFCFEKSNDNDEVIGVIGVNPPVSFGPADVSNWVGALPTVAANVDGLDVITVNGTGLLGNKFMSGRLGSVSTGLPAFVVDGVDGLSGGGFIAKDSEWLDDGTELKDANDKLVDLGKYISVVGAQAILSNSFSDNAYTSTGGPAYMGFVSSLPPNSAPTNKLMPGVRLPFRLNLPKLDALAGAGYVMFQTKPKGIVVSDSPTAARASSDYTRLTTVRIVKAVMDTVRTVSDPFIGEALNSARLAALDTAIDQGLVKLQKAGFLQRFDKRLVSTPADQVVGRARLDLVLVVAFELRHIQVTISLAAQ